jgi:hypothetical protein
LILIGLALLISAARTVTAQTNPNPGLQSEQSQVNKSKAKIEHQPIEQSMVPIEPKCAAEGEKREATYKKTRAIDLVMPSDAAMTWFTGLLVVVGFIQAWILRATLIVSRASQRAYILVKCENAAGIAPGDSPRVVVIFKNFGSTPAYRLRYRCQISFVEYPMANDRKLPKLTGPTSPEMTISPGVEYGNPLVSSTPLTHERFNEMEARKERLFIYGTVRYRTLSAWHYTAFAFLFLGDRTFIMAPVGNDAN